MLTNLIAVHTVSLIVDDFCELMWTDWAILLFMFIMSIRLKSFAPKLDQLFFFDLTFDQKQKAMSLLIALAILNLAAVGPRPVFSSVTLRWRQCLCYAIPHYLLSSSVDNKPCRWHCQTDDSSTFLFGIEHLSSTEQNDRDDSVLLSKWFTVVVAFDTAVAVAITADVVGHVSNTANVDTRE